MVYGRLVYLGGEGRLIVMGYAYLWQNYPAQVRVNLSVPTHTIEPLRNNQKYIYREMKPHVYKITRYTKHSDLYAIVYQRLTKSVLKGALLRYKRASFTPQKSIFYHAKGHLLLYKKPPAIPNL